MFGIQLGMPINPDSFIEPEIYRFERVPPFYDFIDKAQKSLKLNEEMRGFGIKRASVNFELDSFKVESIRAQSEYESWEEAQQQAQFVCEHFSKNYGGECKDVLELEPEQLLKNSLWPSEIYYKDFRNEYMLTIHVGRRRNPAIYGKIINFFHLDYEIFRDRYQECFDSFKGPDHFGFNEGLDPYIECADLKR